MYNYLNLEIAWHNALSDAQKRKRKMYKRNKKRYVFLV